MSTKFTVHCLKGSADREGQVKKALQAGLGASVIWNSNPHAFTVAHDDGVLVNKFVNSLGPNFVTLDDNKSKGKYVSYMHRSESTIKFKSKATKVTSYGNTAATMAKRYNFPT